MRAVNKVESVLTTETLSARDISSILGTLQHLTFVYRSGQHSLSSIALFLSKFPNNFVRHHLPTAACCDLTWWHKLLSCPDVSRSLIPLPYLDPNIWVDASSSWGIGLVVGSQWAVWHLTSGWSDGDCDIGWAEGVALELAVSWLLAENFHDADIIVRSDNSSVVSAFWKGRSRNTSRNDSISCISVALSQSNLSLSPIFVPSAQNRTDPVSWGCLGSESSRIAAYIEVPDALSIFLQRV